MNHLTVEFMVVDFASRIDLNQYYLKNYVCDSVEELTQEIYSNLSVVLKPVSINHVFFTSEKNLVCVVYKLDRAYIMSEMVGINTIGSPSIRQLISNSKLFDRYYPSSKINKTLKKSIFIFLRYCEAKGMGGADGHPENIVYRDRNLFLISKVALK